MTCVNHDDISKIETLVLETPKLWFAGLSRFLGCASESYTSAHSTNIAVPDSGTCARRWRTPGDFSRSFFHREERGRRAVLLRESKHVTFPKGVAPTKKRDLSRGWVSGSSRSLKRFLRYEDHRSGIPLFDCRVQRGCTCYDGWD